MQKHFTKVVFAALAMLTAALPLRADEWRFDGVDRIVAIADVHGAHGPMVAALEAANVIDGSLGWSGGSTHLVIVGDLLDRGPDSRAAMDLLMRLEHEAAAAGGRVHVLIGNHEAMNLMGDLRYVSAREYAAFELDERPDERERWFEAWTRLRAGAEQAPEGLRVQFRQRYPAGYFAHRREFASNGVYGRWLLSKPVLIVINDTAFVHGGLSPMITEMGLDGVNGRLRQEMIEYVEQVDVLVEASVLLPTDSLHDHEAILRRYLPPIDTSADVLRAVAAVRRLANSDLHALDGPLWYRGNVVCSELIEADKLSAALDAIRAKRVVIGHTPTPGRRVLERFAGRLIEIDTGMLNAYYGGSANALIIENDTVTAVNQDAGSTTPAPHPRSVGSRPAGPMSAEQIESVLQSGEIVARRTDEARGDVVTLSDGTGSLDAVFVKRAGRGFYPEVAAYRLDRLLELDMVPVTVRRVVAGEDGALQFLPGNTINEFERQEEGSGGSAWCPIAEQWEAMFVFDVLIHNAGRTGLNLYYDLDWWRVVLTDHGLAFSTGKGVPERMRGIPVKLSQAWRDALAEMSEETLSEKLGDVLDKKRIRALVDRAEDLLTN